jgi:glutamyl-tRNA synthetase
MRTERGNGVWRFKLDQERINWKDGILGDISIDAASVSDPVLIRGDGQVLYTIASVVDDTDMGVTHVVRGSDHVTNTATQIQIMKALGMAPPEFAHHSLLTGPQGEALSKRLGTLALRDLREQGIQPMALLSMMARLGSSDPMELRSEMSELIDGFEVGHFGSAPTKFDVADLFPLTAHVLQAKPLADVADQIAALGVPDDLAESFWTVTRGNITTLNDLGAWWTLFSEGAEPVIDDEDAEFVATAMALLPNGPFDGETWKSWTTVVKEATGRKGKGLFMPLRKALTGQSHGPDMSATMPLLQVIKARA